VCASNSKALLGVRRNCEGIVILRGFKLNHSSAVSDLFALRYTSCMQSIKGPVLCLARRGAFRAPRQQLG